MLFVGTGGLEITAFWMTTAYLGVSDACTCTSLT